MNVLSFILNPDLLLRPKGPLICIAQPEGLGTEANV